MRDLLIVGITIAAALMALRRPWIGVMLWTWLSIMNPHRYAWGLAYSAPLAAIAVGVTLTGMLFSRDWQHPFKGAPVVWLLVFASWMTLSWVLGFDPDGDYELWSRVAKIYFMTFVALCLLQSKHHVFAFAWITTMSLALLGAKGGVFTILSGGGYRVWGPAGSFIEDNNAFALALIVTIPMLHFLQLHVKLRIAVYALSAIMLLCAAAALGSQSRGALLALVAMGAMLWWRSRRKGPMLIAVLVVALVLVPFMPEQWWDRMATIGSYETDDSAVGRLNGWIVAIEVAKHHFFGGGMSYQHQLFFTLYGHYNADVIAAHSIYFQVLGNHGFVGLILYLGLWISTFRCASWLRRNAGSTPESRWAVDLGAMVQVGLIGFAVGGAFLSLSYFDLPYNLMVLVVVARAWVQRRAWELEPKVPFRVYAGVARSPAMSGVRSTV